MNEMKNEPMLTRAGATQPVPASNLQSSFRTRTQTPSLQLTAATGRSIAQHGEILQGQMEDAASRPRRFLLSLPCDRFYSAVTFAPSRNSPLSVEPAHKEKVKKVVELTLNYLGKEDVGGRLTVETNIEEGKGYGSSTADCVAGVYAVAQATGRSLTDAEVALLVVEAETASDNFMFERPVLFAHREGVVLEELGPRIPKLEVLGVDTEIDGVVYTLDYPPATYSWRQVQEFHMLISALRRAIRYEDLPLLGRVATASSVVNQQFLPKPLFGEIRRLAEHAGTLGIAVAHSGTVASILLDPVDPLLETKVDLIRTELDRLGINRVLRFHT
jgi:uncharacterized protein involved in propanediol utilization